ncbi:hypothetical protein M0638_07250 [Roseomonas sp. NAR14]|uniref:Uncharacterized protein n=1 Tax=Roseomonas acroporae TaxID=2937791 RepID=A0A9X1YCV5_9PROT|nr:hypothetical protein [Roseomonas acroporae]MCK8784171.1 hypothetical protein [Roseomonas acroporae]
MTSTDTVIDQPLLADALDGGRTRRPWRYPAKPRVLEPVVEPVLADGKPALRVQLSGGRAAALGARMLIDREDWDRVSAKAGKCWTLSTNGSDNALVISTARIAGRLAGQDGPKPKAVLARLIVGGAELLRGQVVRYRNGDPWDLRRANLIALPRSEARSWRPDMPKPDIVTVQ